MNSLKDLRNEVEHAQKMHGKSEYRFGYLRALDDIEKLIEYHQKVIYNDEVITDFTFNVLQYLLGKEDL